MFYKLDHVIKKITDIWFKVEKTVKLNKLSNIKE